jgi:uncharacterized coiled-coil protein SlyX
MKASILRHPVALKLAQIANDRTIREQAKAIAGLERVNAKQQRVIDKLSSELGILKEQFRRDSAAIKEGSR